MSSKSLPFALALLAATTALSQAATFLIDFGTNSPSSAYPGTDPWNTFTTANIGSNPGLQLTDTSGSTSTIRLRGTGTINQGGDAGAGTATFNNANTPSGLSWLATPSANAAAGDWFYTTTTTGDFTHTYTISNLAAGNLFSLDVISARNSGTALGRYSYSLDGTNWVGFNVVDSDGNAVTTDGWAANTTLTQSFNSQTQGYTAYRYMNASGVTLTGSNLFIRVEDVGNNGSFSGINAMRFTVIPEPSQAIFIVAGFALSAFRRRR